MVVLERRVRFEEVDAARIVFFGVFSSYAHEAMERFFDQVQGGYPALINDRRVGFPTVKLEAEFHAPLRYGNAIRIETSVAHLGNRSATFLDEVLRGDGVLSATIRHTVVTVDLDALTPLDMPPDVRAAFERHLAR